MILIYAAFSGPVLSAIIKLDDAELRHEMDDVQSYRQWSDKGSNDRRRLHSRQGQILLLQEGT